MKLKSSGQQMILSFNQDVALHNEFFLTSTISDKGIVSRIYKEFKKLSIKNKNRVSTCVVWVSHHLCWGKTFQWSSLLSVPPWSCKSPLTNALYINSINSWIHPIKRKTPSQLDQRRPMETPKTTQAIAKAIGCLNCPIVEDDSNT